MAAICNKVCDGLAADCTKWLSYNPTVLEKRHRSKNETTVRLVFLTLLPSLMKHVEGEAVNEAV